MIFDPNLEDYRTKPIEYLKYLMDKSKRFELKELRKRRTINQKGYLYFAFKQVQIDTGYSLEEVKQTLFKEICNPDIFIREGRLGKYLRSSEEVNTKEMSLATERFRDYCVSEMDIYIPEPNEEEKIKMWEAELSRNS